MKVFVFDAAKCNGCYGCQFACKDEHVGNEWLPYAVPQPNTGHFWLKIQEKTHGQVPKVKVEYRPWLCMHCDDPICAKAASDAVYKRDDGLVIIDPIKAKGNRSLVDSCPYGVIYWNSEKDVAQKCTGCAHLVDEGRPPHCVDFCATGGLRFGELEEFRQELLDAETFDIAGTGPRVYYLNLPHLFLSGDVWDPKKNEIIEGASVTLTFPDGSIRVAETDDYGDFYFRRIDAGTYSLHIEADGFKAVDRSGIELTESLNIGDFPMERID